MTVIVLDNFRGYNKAFQPHTLPDGMGQEAANFDLTARSLKPFKEPDVVASKVLTSPATSFYEVRDSSGASHYVSWTNEVYLARIPDASSADDQLVLSSPDFEPRFTRADYLTSGPLALPTNFYVLGVPAPQTAPSVSVSGGTAASESRTYVYTFVDAEGFESAPSPASAVVTGASDGTWTITLPDTFPPNGGSITAVSSSGTTHTVTLDSVLGLRVGEQINLQTATGTADYKIIAVDTVASTVTVTGSVAPTTGAWARTAPFNSSGAVKRIYRSTSSGWSLLVDANGVALEVPASAGNNSVTDAGYYGETLPLYDALMPPTDLKQIIAMPNGMLAGFRGSELCFTEPYRPYAWPKEYRYALDDEIVGIVAVGSSVFVATESHPYWFTGVDPFNMTQGVVGDHYPCVSRRSVVGFKGGAVFASNTGLVHVTPQGARLLTRDIFSDTAWAALNPSSMQIVFLDGRLYVLHNTGGVSNVFVLDLVHPEWGVMDLSLSHTESLSTTKTGTGLLFGINRDVKQWDVKTGFNLSYTWTSRRMILPMPTTLTAFRIDGSSALQTVTSSTVAVASATQANLNAINQTQGPGGVLNQDPLNTYALNGSQVVPVSIAVGSDKLVTMELFVDGQLKYSMTVGDKRIYRLPYLGKMFDFSVRLRGKAEVARIVFANNPTELRKV